MTTPTAATEHRRQVCTWIGCEAELPYHHVYCRQHLPLARQLLAAHRDGQDPVGTPNYADHRRAAAAILHMINPDGQDIDGFNAILSEAAECQRGTEFVCALLSTVIETAPAIASDAGRVVMRARLNAFAEAEARAETAAA